MPDLSSILRKVIGKPDTKEAKQRLMLIYGAGFLLVFLLYFFLLLQPTLSKLFDILPKLREYRLDIRGVHSDLQFEDKLRKRVSALEKKLDSYEKSLSREKEIPVLLENLSNLARDARVKILGITPVDAGSLRTGGQEKDDSIYQEVPIVINAQSEYHDLGIFINTLENGQRYLQISDIEIKSNRNNPKRHDVKFIVYAYTFKSEQDGLQNNNIKNETAKTKKE